MKNSAGILIYRITEDKRAKVLLVHSSGRDDLESWSIPKGEFDPDEESPSHAAVREVHEELGLNIPESELKDLGESTYKNKSKKVHGFSWEIKCEDLKLALVLDIKEIKVVGLFSADYAKEILHEAQIGFIKLLLRQLP